MNKKIHFLLLAFLSLGLVSCGDDENDGKNPIHGIEATTKIDLSRYENLNCWVNSVEYDFKIAGEKLSITPKTGGEIAYTMPYDSEMTGGSSGVWVSLLQPSIDWAGKVDQSSWSKMMHYDVLSANRGGNLPSIITDLKLVHQFSMLHFTTKDLPENAVITIKCDDYNTIIPRITREGVYQCIPPLALETKILVVVDGKEYLTDGFYDAMKPKSKLVLRDSNNFYTFQLEFRPDAEKDEDKLVINNGKVEEWVNQHLVE